MAKKSARKKTTAQISRGELPLLQILWENGPLTLGETHQQQIAGLGYTTIQTQLNRMVDKGLVRRTKTRPAKYQASISPSDASAKLLQLLVETIGCGSILPIVDQLLALNPLSSAEILELKRLTSRAKKKSNRPRTKSAKRRVKSAIS